MSDRLPPLLVGEAPSSTSPPDRPLAGRSGATLIGYMGLGGGYEGNLGPAYEKLCSMFRPVNLFDERLPRGEGEKGTKWPPKAVAREAAAPFRRNPDDRNVVVLGKRVAEAMGLVGAPYWVWSALDDAPPRSKTMFVVVPHPSGIVRLYNEPQNRMRTGYVLWQAVGKIPK